MRKVLTTIGMILTIVLLAIIAIACQGGIVGNGRVETRTEDIGKFTRLVVNGNFNIILEQTDKPSLRLEMDENLLEITKVTEDGNTLRIETKINILQAREKNLIIGVQDLEKLDLGGAVKVTADSTLHFESLGILASGAVRIDFAIEGRQLKLDLAGASECDLRGKVDELRIQLSGAGDFDAFDLITKDTEIDMSGAGSARVYATEKLDVSISGAGSVKYRGEPELHKNISGLGSLKRDKY
jgi:hypothetical protein